MIGFIISIIAGVIIVPLLKKIKAKQTLSSYLFKKHKEAKQPKAQYPHGNIIIG